VTIHPVPRPGEKPDHVAIGGKRYVYSLASLDCVATIIDENLRPSPLGQHSPALDQARLSPNLSRGKQPTRFELGINLQDREGAGAHLQAETTTAPVRSLGARRRQQNAGAAAFEPVRRGS
jgi:hypothetical protein